MGIDPNLINRLAGVISGDTSSTTRPSSPGAQGTIIRLATVLSQDTVNQLTYVQFQGSTVTVGCCPNGYTLAAGTVCSVAIYGNSFYILGPASIPVANPDGRMYNNSTTALASGSVVLVSTIKDFTQGGVTFIGTPTFGLQVPTTQKYLVIVKVSFAASGGSGGVTNAGTREAVIALNGGTLDQFTAYTVAGTQPRVPGSGVYLLNAGDVLSIQAFQGSGAADGSLTGTSNTSLTVVGQP